MHLIEVGCILDPVQDPDLTYGSGWIQALSAAEMKEKMHFKFAACVCQPKF